MSEKDYMLVEEAVTIDKKISSELKADALEMSDHEARLLVDTFVAIQKFRIRTENQIRAESEQMNVVQAMLNHLAKEEERCAKFFDYYTNAKDRIPTRWARSIMGVGPTLAIKLFTYIDITKAPTVGHIWSFAGLNPTMVWGKGEKRPFNASLKTACWNIGEAFVKVHNNPNDIYGHVYAERKILEETRNEQLGYADQAEAVLKARKIGKSTDAYKAYSIGKLPPAHIHARAKRYAVKLFLAHYHEVAYFDHYREMPPKPYVITQLHHAHYVGAPNWPWK